VGQPEDQANLEHAEDLLQAFEETVPPARPDSNDERGLRRIRNRANKINAIAEARRSSSLTVDVAMRLRERNRRIPATLLAGALASRLVFFMIPFLVLAVVATGLYSGVNAVDPIETARNAGLAGLLADAVDDSSQASTGFQTATVIGMAFAALWAANSLAKLVRSIHALVWSVPIAAPRRRWTLPVSVLVVSIGGLAISHLGLVALDWPAYVAAGEVLLEVGLCTLGWLLVLRFLPHDPEARGWFTHIPGALLVGGGLIAMKAAVIFYLAPRVTTLSQRYGDVASAVLMLTWAYWLALIIVLGAELNAVFHGNRRHRLGLSEGPPRENQ
jgi:membrane protein